MPPGLGLEAGGLGKGAAAGVELRALIRPRGRGDERDGNCRRAAGGQKGWMHRKGEPLRRPELARPLAMVKARAGPVNLALGLTLYCSGIRGKATGPIAMTSR